MKKKKFFSRTLFSFSWWYKVTCDYGESCTKPIMLLGAVIGIATLIFFLEDVSKVNYVTTVSDESSNIIPFSLENMDSVLYNATKRSVSTLTPFFELQKTELSDYVFRLLTLPLLGTLFIALRRNLERRFRH